MSFVAQTAVKNVQSRTHASPFSAQTTTHSFRSACPATQRVAVSDLHDFKRGRGDLVFSVFMLLVAVFFFAFFWTETGWQARKLPDQFGLYLFDQLGLIEREGRAERFGKILKQSWVAPFLCLCVLLPAAAINLRGSLRTHRWRKRFMLPTALKHEATLWLRALEFVAVFLVYTLAVPILGYLMSTLLLGVLLPQRLGYRGWRWAGICLAVSFAIVVVFRTGLQIKTPVNIWLYAQLPQGWESFMQTYF